jgi:hypothetical protein
VEVIGSGVDEGGTHVRIGQIVGQRCCRALPTEHRPYIGQQVIPNIGLVGRAWLAKAEADTDI